MSDQMPDPELPEPNTPGPRFEMPSEPAQPAEPTTPGEPDASPFITPSVPPSEPAYQAPPSPPRTRPRETSRPARPARPDNYLVWAILTTLFCCLPFGIASIVFAGQVNAKYDAGDYRGAQASSDKARTWAIASAVSGIIIIVIYMAALSSA